MRRLFAVAAFASVLASPALADWPYMGRATEGSGPGWQLYDFPERAGCGAVVALGVGKQMLFVLDTTAETAAPAMVIEFTSPDWDVNARIFALDLDFGATPRTETFTGFYIAGTEGLSATLPATETEALLTELAGATRVSLSYDGQVVIDRALEGAAAMVDAVRTCTETRN